MRNMVLNYKKSDFFLYIPNICCTFAASKNEVNRAHVAKKNVAP